jgi:hypothetical protein
MELSTCRPNSYLSVGVQNLYVAILNEVAYKAKAKICFMGSETNEQLCRKALAEDSVAKMRPSMISGKSKASFVEVLQAGWTLVVAGNISTSADSKPSHYISYHYDITEKPKEHSTIEHQEENSTIIVKNSLGGGEPSEDTCAKAYGMLYLLHSIGKIPSRAKVELALNVRQQDNYQDCGMHVLSHMQQALNVAMGLSPDHLTPINMVEFRLMVLYRIFSSVESRWWNHNIINVIKEPLSVKSSDNSSSGEVDVVKVVESPLKQKNHNAIVPKVIIITKKDDVSIVNSNLSSKSDDSQSGSVFYHVPTYLKTQYLTADNGADLPKSAIAKYYNKDNGKQDRNDYYSLQKRTLIKKISDLFRSKAETRTIIG